MRDRITRFGNRRFFCHNSAVLAPTVHFLTHPSFSWRVSIGSVIWDVNTLHFIHHNHIALEPQASFCVGCYLVLVFLILVSVTKVILRYHYFYKYLLIPFHVIHGAREVMNTRNENSHVFFYSQLREKETNIAIRARAHFKKSISLFTQPVEVTSVPLVILKDYSTLYSWFRMNQRNNCFVFQPIKVPPLE